MLFPVKKKMTNTDINQVNITIVQLTAEC